MDVSLKLLSSYIIHETTITKINFQGEKKREQTAASGSGGGVQERNEIVACTSCGVDGAPCTHSANNGCATEVILYF